jgi:hypothetical protein
MSNAEPIRLASRRILSIAGRPDRPLTAPRERGPIRRTPRPGPSISSAWLRFAGDRPKLAAVLVRA